MWLWILIGLNIITKVHGFSSGFFPQSCDSMSPEHTRNGVLLDPQDTEPPFKITYTPGKEGDPITDAPSGHCAAQDDCDWFKEIQTSQGVIFFPQQRCGDKSGYSKQSTEFKGFMLEARERGMAEGGRPVGKFMLFEDDRRSRLLSCNNLADKAVSQRNNQRKTLIQVNWTTQGPERDITFRATFVQNTDIFWEGVYLNVTLLSPTTPLPTPSTAASIGTTNPSSTIGTTNPSSTIGTTNPSSTIGTTNPSTTSITTKPSTVNPSTQPSTAKTSMTTQEVLGVFNRLEGAGTMGMTASSFLVVVKMELSNIFTITLPNSPFSHRLHKVSKISCSLLCAAVEISAVVLFCVADSIKVTLVTLVCVAIAINFIELAIVCLPIGPSHELKEICDLTVKVCSVIHEIFTIAVIFVGVLELDNCGKNRKDSWLLKVMIAYTVWILLFVIWVFVSSTQKETILGRSKIGSPKNSQSWSQQRKKKRLSAAEVIVTAVSVIFIVGNLCFTGAIIAGIIDCQE